MMVEPWIAILAVAFTVYFTRFIGFYISDFIPENQGYKSTLRILPICAMISFFIPASLAGNPFEISMLGLFLIVFWLSNNALLSMLIGVGGLLIGTLI